MKESKFINQNKSKWLEFDELSKMKSNDPAKLSKLFIQITDDLSYARTFYKNRQVRYFLNSISQYLFINIYKNHKLKVSDFTKFWKKTLPLTMYEVRKEFLFAFLLFVVSFSIGMLSCANDSGFSRLILSDEYIRMTLDNIKNNNPMGVYKKSGELDMMFGITINNLFVSVMTFVMGVFASVGSLFTMIYNGIMVGTFQYFFIERGLFWKSFLTIWQHGTLEISSIIIAGTAGIKLGKGILFPGTYTRFQAFRISARKGLMVLSGILPVIIFAAFIESFFTRYTELPDALRFLVIIFSLAFIIGYFVLFPRRVHRKFGHEILDKESIEFKQKVNFELTEVYSGGQLFENTLHFYKQNFGKFFRFVFIVTSAYTLVYGVVNLYFMLTLTQNYALDFQNISNFFMYNSLDNWTYFIYNVVFQSIILLLFFFQVYKIYGNNDSKTPKKVSFILRSLVPVLISILILNLILFIPHFTRWFLVAAIFPILISLAFFSQHNKEFFLNSINGYTKRMKSEYSSLYGLVYKYILLGLLILILLNTPVFKNNIMLLFWNLNLKENALRIFTSIFFEFISMFIIFSFLSLISIALGLFYFSNYEKYSANSLKSKVEKIGMGRKIIGYERE